METSSFSAASTTKSRSAVTVSSPVRFAPILNTYPSIRDSHVLARRRKSGELSLCAYYVADHTAGNIPKDSELRDFLRERLPNYMVPGSLSRVETIPLTPNGKVDHQALPDLESDPIATPREFVEPRDETERVLCRIWAETLKLKRVGIDDDFFASAVTHYWQPSYSRVWMSSLAAHCRWASSFQLRRYGLWRSVIGRRRSRNFGRW